MAELDFTHVQEALDRAGLTMTDLANITPFCRSTLYNWKNGTKKPHDFYSDTLRGWVRLINIATDAQLLPVPHHLLGNDRKRAVKNVLKQARQIKTG